MKQIKPTLNTQAKREKNEGCLNYLIRTLNEEQNNAIRVILKFEKSELIDEIEKEVIGKDEEKTEIAFPGNLTDTEMRNKLRQQQRKSLAAIRERIK